MTASEPRGGRLVTILVGTDHHPFVRAVAWADARQRAHPEESVTVQYGDSDAPLAASGMAFMPQADLQALVARSHVVITHGGPGTIMDVRNAGHRPIVVPRDPTFGEHVDNHQVLFGGWCEAKGLVRLVTNVGTLDGVVDALGDAGTTESLTAVHSTDETASRLQQLLAHTAGHRRPVALGSPRVVALTGAAGPVRVVTGVLETVPAVSVLGEVSSLWQHGPADSTRCSCGDAVTDCALWGPIGKRAFGGWDALDAQHARRLQAAATGWRAARRRMSPPARRRLLAYTDLHRRVHRAAREVSGAQVLVESHESPLTTLALSHDTGIELSVVDTGREPDGVDGPRAQEAALWALAHRGVPVERLRPETGPDPATRLRHAWQRAGLPELPVLPARGDVPGGDAAGHTLLTPTKVGR